METSTSKNKSLLKLLIFTSFLTEPIVSLHFLFDYTAIIDFVVMLVLMILAYSRRGTPKTLTNISKIVLLSLGFIILKSFVVDGFGSVFGSELGQYMKTFFSLIYLFICYTLFEEKKLIINFRIWEKFIFFVCICTIISIILYRTGFNFLFIKKDILNYPCEQLPFVGLVHYDDNAKIRPSWFFQEPSYLGDFLGFNFMMVSRYYLKYRKWKKTLIYILTILITGSMTGVGCTLIAFTIYLIQKRISFLNNHSVLVKIVMVVLLPTAMTVYSTFDIQELKDQSSIVGGSSISTRQARMAYGLEQIATATPNQLIWGRGKRFNEDFGLGVSNCYVQLLCADGALVLMFFLILVYVLLKRSDYEYYYMVIAMNAISLSFLPFIFLMMLVANQYYKNDINAILA